MLAKISTAPKSGVDLNSNPFKVVSATTVKGLGLVEFTDLYSIYILLHATEFLTSEKTSQIDFILSLKAISNLHGQSYG